MWKSLEFENNLAGCVVFPKWLILLDKFRAVSGAREITG